ncbi:MAG: DUF393 domain-containing protein [bacterium]|nr:DUF393 domain-containing protein [bacterium]
MSNWNFKMFFDGDCPMCTREVDFLKSKNNKGTLAFENTASPGFSPEKYGITTNTERIIHGILPDGTIVSGVEVFRRAYKEIGLGWLLAPTGWPILKPIFDAMYVVFARNRIRIGKFFGRKCEAGSCDIK